ncbi:aspartyl/lysyl-trna synthetase [Holotrichia oblita]|nr:aspartyl/lysyl-trna synthetase [Holotrichia oblita]
MHIRIKNILSEPAVYAGNKLTACGWVKTVRDNKTFGFIELNDGSCFKSIQVVFDDSLNNFSEVSKLGVGASIAVTGVLVESSGSKQPYEIKADSIEICCASTTDYPLQKKRHTNEYLRTIAHLRPRTNTFSAVFRVRSHVSYAIHKFFIDRGFVYVHTPIITASDCEGAGEMFQVTTMDLKNIPKNADGQVDFSNDFFTKQANLTVSGQLSAETFAHAFTDVYTFGPTFRAENSNTARHAAEFWMVEPEIAFAELDDNMKLAEDMLKFIINYVIENAPDELDFFNKFIDDTLIERLQNIVSSDFGHVTYTEAIELLKNSGVKFDYPVKWGMDLQTEHERYISEKIFKKPVFVTDYPKEIKAFYMRINDDNKTVAAMDLLVPGVGEIIGGSQREERLDVLLRRMKEMNLKEEDYWWYLDLRRYGGTKHAGFGLGLERCIMYITGMTNIRDVIPEKTYTGKILDVVQDTIILPDGREAVREVVLHTQAAAVLPVDNEGKIIFVRQYRHPARAMVLEIPAGVFDSEEETPETCALRELEEETGYKAGKLTYLFPIYSTIGFCNEIIHIFIAEDLIESSTNYDEDEFITLERYNACEAVDMVFKGKIVDSKTMLAILSYKELKLT